MQYEQKEAKHMENNPSTHVRPLSLFWRVLQFPLPRIIFATLFVVIGVVAAQVLITLLKQTFALSSPLPIPFVLVEIILALLATYGAYYAYVHFVEQRPVAELGRQGAVRGLGIGALLGIGLFTLVIGILWLLGTYRVTGTNEWPVLFVALAANLPSAFVQQILLLGILFRITEQTVGTWWALLISVLLFGLVHFISIPHITVMDMLSILLGGLLFVTTYLLTRTLWLPIGLHAALDFTKDGIFGAGTAGTSAVALKGLLQAHLTGPVLLTGGDAGAEASLVTIVVLVAVGVYLVVRAKQQGQLLKPFWRRERQVTETG